MNLELIKIATIHFNKAANLKGGFCYGDVEKSSGGIYKPSKPKLVRKRKPSNNKWLRFYKSECKKPKYKKLNSRKKMSEIAKAYKS